MLPSMQYHPPIHAGVRSRVANENYDAIVVGSGISGGWAAKELTEKGLTVLLLERGKNIRTT
jgi:choline dehydrogenase-like flavoprotein